MPESAQAGIGVSGPDQSLIDHACGERKLAVEDRHGRQSDGACTYPLGLATLIDTC